MGILKLGCADHSEPFLFLRKLSQVTSQVPLQSNSGQHLCPQASQISAHASPCQSFSMTALEIQKKHGFMLSSLNIDRSWLLVMNILCSLLSCPFLLHFPELHHNFQMGQNHLRWHRTGSHNSEEISWKYEIRRNFKKYFSKCFGYQSCFHFWLSPH